MELTDQQARELGRMADVPEELIAELRERQACDHADMLIGPAVAQCRKCGLCASTERVLAAVAYPASVRA